MKNGIISIDVNPVLETCEPVLAVMRELPYYLTPGECITGLGFMFLCAVVLVQGSRINSLTKKKVKKS